MDDRVAARPRGDDRTFDTHPAPTLIVDADFRLVRVNAAARALISASTDVPAPTRGELLRCVHSFGPGGCGAQAICAECAVRRSVQAALATGAVQRATSVLRVRRGAADVDACYLVTAAPIRREPLDEVVLTLEDVSDPVRLTSEVAHAERARSASEAALNDRLSQIAESVPGAICSFVLRPDGSMAMPFTTRGIEDVYGFSQQALAESIAPLVERLYREDAPGVLEHIAEAARGPSRWHDVYRYHHPTKGLRWIEGWWVPNAGRDGTVVWHGYVTDVTDRKVAEEALRRSDERYRDLVHVSPDAIIVNSNGRIAFVNPAAVRLFGATDGSELLGRSPFELFHRDFHELIRKRVATVLSGEPVPWVEERIVRVDGSVRDVEVVAAPLHDAEGRAVQVVLRDITARNLAERERERLQQELADARKLESIGRLAGGIAHDFNNLLTVILSCGEALREHLGAGAPPDAEYVEDILAAAQRARDLTRQLLAVARKQVLSPVPLDLNAVVEGAGKLLRRVLGEDVELQVALQPGLWAVQCDPAQIEQIVLNLAVNARDAMPDGGVLAIATANVDVGSDDDGRPVEQVRLTVRDSGAGMSADVKAHLFEPFFTTKPRGAGTGLGLATVYGIVKQSGGVIAVSSEPGRGTIFDIRFPRVPGEARPPPRSPPVERLGGSETVLVVEDDQHVREVTVRALHAAGYRVLAAGSGREAFDLAATDAELDLLVTDVVMPGLDGRAVAAELGRRRPGLRVLYVSGYTQDAIVRRGVLEAGIDFLPKPFNASALLARVREILDRS